jgi:hypothetical protein
MTISTLTPKVAKCPYCGREFEAGDVRYYDHVERCIDMKNKAKDKVRLLK